MPNLSSCCSIDSFFCLPVLLALQCSASPPCVSYVFSHCLICNLFQLLHCPLALCPSSLCWSSLTLCLWTPASWATSSQEARGDLESCWVDKVFVLWTIALICAPLFLSLVPFCHRKRLQGLKKTCRVFVLCLPKGSVAWAAECSPHAGGESEVAHQRGLQEAVLHICYAGLITNCSVFSRCIHYHWPGSERAKWGSCRMADPKQAVVQEVFGYFWELLRSPVKSERYLQEMHRCGVSCCLWRLRAGELVGLTGAAGQEDVRFPKRAVWGGGGKTTGGNM